jgi:hypothetical protein
MIEVDKYIDGKNVVSDSVQRKQKRYGINNSMAEQHSSLIEVYRMNYIENLSYLLSYTGMSKKQYSLRMRAAGVRNGISMYNAIMKKTVLGFDIIVVAALAQTFKLPTTLLLNHRISEIEGFNLEEYGVFRNMHSDRKRSISIRERLLVNQSPKTVFKKMNYNKFKSISDFPCGAVNIWNYVR